MIVDFDEAIKRSNLGQEVELTHERLKLIPGHLQYDLDDAIVYAYLTLLYFDEHLFTAIVKKTNKFKGRRDYQDLFSFGPAYFLLSDESSFQH